MTDSAQEWLSLLQAFVPAPPPSAVDHPLARHLGTYRCLLESWEQALDADAPDPCAHSLAALAGYVQRECVRQVRGLLSPGPAWDAVVSLPLLPMNPFLAGLAVPGMSQAAALWRAVVAYQRDLDRFCALYESIGSATLARLEAILADPREPAIESVAALHAQWQRCQDACEAAIIRDGAFAERLAAVVSAGGALRAAHSGWLALYPGVTTDPGAQQALSEEIAAIRRQLRTVTVRFDGGN